MTDKTSCLECEYYRPATWFCCSTCDVGRYAFPELIQRLGCKNYVERSN